MSVDYDAFAKSFAKSRKNMKWEELEYFFSFLEWEENILDIGCWSGRLLEWYKSSFWKLPEEYTWVDLSEWLLEEAKKSYPNFIFEQKNMLDIDERNIQNIFMIASFHHLKTLEEREKMIHILFETLEEGWKIFMTNWALESPLNKEKYSKSQIQESENKFWSKDFSIKIGKHARYYHSFSLSELEYLAKKAGFHILENRLFSTEKNIITILQK